MISNEFMFKDAFNLDKKRNVKNTPFDIFNCGGYALNTFSWYMPKRKCTMSYYANSTSEMRRKTKRCVQIMLEDFSDLRVIKSIKELQKDEYALAFRISTQIDDFHYIKRARNGKWYSKYGASFIARIPKAKIFDTWCNPIGDIYDGEIVLFAKKF